MENTDFLREFARVEAALHRILPITNRRIGLASLLQELKGRNLLQDDTLERLERVIRARNSVVSSKINQKITETVAADLKWLSSFLNFDV